MGLGEKTSFFSVARESRTNPIRIESVVVVRITVVVHISKITAVRDGTKPQIVFYNKDPFLLSDFLTAFRRLISLASFSEMTL